MPGTNATLDAEWSILLAACSEICSEISRQEKTDRIRPLLRQPDRWKFLLELAGRHGVQPLLYQVLVEIKNVIPADQTPRLEQCHQLNLHKALLLSRVLIRIVDQLREFGLDVMPY